MSSVDNRPPVAAIAVVDRRGAIGYRGRLLCHLPADLRHFKQLTMGHSVVMGRRTYDSLPGGPLPGRQNIVVTRQTDFAPEGVTVAHSLDEALTLADRPGEVMIMGGAQIYAAAMPLVTRLYLTIVGHAFTDVDAWFPPIDVDRWVETCREHHTADERNRYDYDFVTLDRRL